LLLCPPPLTAAPAAAAAAAPATLELDRPGRPRKKALLASRSKTRRRARRREDRKEGRMLLLLVVDDEDDDDGLKPISTHLKRARGRKNASGQRREGGRGGDERRGLARPLSSLWMYVCAYACA